MKKLMTEEQKRKAVYALNLVTVSVSQITSYRDLIIMKQEYDAILNNINLQNIIHDQELLDILKHILDVITFFQIQDKEKEFIDREYQQKMKNAIWSAVPNIGMILSGPLNWGMAITMAVQIGAGYMNYRKEKANTSLEKDRKLWELERSAIEQLNGLRRELFNCAWKLSDKYNFDDNLRLTEKQIDAYNKILLDKDPIRRYERLDVIKNDYQAYAPFWYNLGHAAKEVADNCFNASYRTSGWIDNDDKRIYEKYSKIALENFKTFNKNYISLLREDVIYSSCALEQIPLLMLEDENSKQIPELLKNATKYAGGNFDLLQQIVLNDLRFEDKIEESQNILRRLVNEDYNTSVNAQILSGLYIKQNKKEEYDLLTHRIDEHIDPSYLIPWPVSKELINEEYYSNKRKNLSRQIDSFFDKLRIETTLTALRYFPFGECFDEYFTKKPAEEKKFYFICNAKNYGIEQIDYMEIFNLQVSMWNNIFEKFSQIQFINEKYSSIQKLANVLMGGYFKPLFELLKKLNSAIQDNDTKSSDKLLKEYFDYLNLINTEVSEAVQLLCTIQYGLNEVIEQTGNDSLGIYSQRVSELFSAFDWVVPYYFPSKKKLTEEDNSFISMRKIGKETEHQKDIIDTANYVKTQLEKGLNNISFEEGCKKFTTPKQLYEFNNQNPLFKKEGINVLAAITTKKGFNFAFDTDSLYFFKNGSFGFCAEYLYKDLNTSEENGKLEIEANIENVIGKRPDCKPYITSKDVNLDQFRDFIESLNILQK